ACSSTRCSARRPARRGRPLPPEPSILAIAAEADDAIANGRQVTPFSTRHAGFGVPQAYAVAAELRRLRQQRGERPIGRKIGFTNRTIWAEFGVHAPIWGDMYDVTVR